MTSTVPHPQATARRSRAWRLSLRDEEGMHLTQAAAAAWLGIHTRTLQEWESRHGRWPAPLWYDRLLTLAPVPEGYRRRA